MEDLLLLWKFKRGSREALARIYEKYVDKLFSLAAGLTGDIHLAQDVVQEVFTALARSADKIKLRGNLRSYLAKCVVNAARSRIRGEVRAAKRLHCFASELAGAAQGEPEEQVIADERARRVMTALAELPYEQRETVLMRIHEDISFKAIAKLQNISINTAQSRYRYGLDKLRSLLSDEVEL
jgi:RNA polymerase sigma-70 factor (ECF subfamily)